MGRAQHIRPLHQARPSRVCFHPLRFDRLRRNGARAGRRFFHRWCRSMPIALRFVDKLLSLALGVAVIFNGIFNYFIGEILSEGICLGLVLIYLTLKIELKSRFIFQLFTLMFFVLISISLMNATSNEIRLLFLYPYLCFIVILLLPVYKEKIGINSDFIAKMFVYFACVSSAYAIAQRLGFELILPLEGELRATGLSRSSLNLTGCLFSTLAISVLTLPMSFRKLIMDLIILSGMIAAGGRGGIICALLLMGIFYLKDFRKNKSAFLGMTLMFFIIVAVSGEYFYRAFTAFDFSEDQSNLDRIESYYQFFQQFEFLGGGVGSTSPAAGRFTEAIGFESLIFNTIYELGVVFSLIFFVGILSWFTKLPKDTKWRACVLATAIFPMLIGQQVYGIPSAFTSLMICLYCLLTYRAKVTHPTKVLMPVSPLSV
jgi:hypothetical protein